MHNDADTDDNNGRNNHHRQRHYYSSFQPHPVSICPRISFSNDFAESHGNGGRGSTSVALRQEPPRAPHCPEAASGSSDFEFSVSNHYMMSADELFFKGRILPSFRESKTTLREELLVEEEEVSERRPTRGSIGRSSAVGRWKGFLGLRKGGKKGDSNKCEGSGDRAFDNNSSQEVLNDDGAVNNFK